MYDSAMLGRPRVQGKSLSGMGCGFNGCKLNGYDADMCRIIHVMSSAFFFILRYTDL